MKTKTLITLLISNVTKKRASEGQLLLKLVLSLRLYFMSQSSPSPRFFIQQLFVTLYLVCVRAIVYSSNCTYPGTYVNYLYTCTFDIIILKFTYSYLFYTARCYHVRLHVLSQLSNWSFSSSSVLCINFVYMAIFDQIETHEECNAKCGLVLFVC